MIYKLKKIFDNIKENVYNTNCLKYMEDLCMTITEQIKILCVRNNVSEAELARRLGKSPQSFNSKMKRGSFTIVELERIAEVLGAEFSRKFILWNGETI